MIESRGKVDPTISKRVKNKRSQESAAEVIPNPAVNALFLRPRGQFTPGSKVLFRGASSAIIPLVLSPHVSLGEVLGTSSVQYVRFAHKFLLDQAHAHQLPCSLPAQLVTNSTLRHSLSRGSFVSGMPSIILDRVIGHSAGTSDTHGRASTNLQAYVDIPYPMYSQSPPFPQVHGRNLSILDNDDKGW